MGNRMIIKVDAEIQGMDELKQQIATVEEAACKLSEEIDKLASLKLTVKACPRKLESQSHT